MRELGWSWCNRNMRDGIRHPPRRVNCGTKGEDAAGAAAVDMNICMRGRNVIEWKWYERYEG
jgi:hypothetical protein